MPLPVLGGHMSKVNPKTPQAIVTRLVTLLFVSDPFSPSFMGRFAAQHLRLLGLPSLRKCCEP
jgi:hypothetical protein